MLPQNSSFKLKDAIDIISDTVVQELDLRLEAAAKDELRKNFANDQTFKVPKMDWKRTSKRVMIVERVDGQFIKLMDPSYENRGTMSAR